MVKNNKKAVMGLNLLPAIVGAIVVGFVFLSVGADVMDQISTTNPGAACIQNDADRGANCSASFNTSYAGLLGLLEMGNFGSTIGLIGAAIVVLTLLAVGLGKVTGNL